MYYFVGRGMCDGLVHRGAALPKRYRKGRAFGVETSWSNPLGLRRGTPRLRLLSNSHRGEHLWCGKNQLFVSRFHYYVFVERSSVLDTASLKDFCPLAYSF